ncbi:MAG: tyrosine-type recombinase/integrase [Bacteroidota bacterium]
MSATLTSADPFDEAARLFLQRTRHARTGSAHTLRAYRTDLRHFGGFLARASLRFDRLRRGHAERYLAELADQAGARTVRRRVSCIRSFYRHARRLEIVVENPFDALDLPAVDRMSETHKVWSEAEVDRALALLRREVRDATAALRSADRPRRPRAWLQLFHATRRRALFVVLVTAGLRRAEVAGLGSASLVHAESGFTLVVRGKGSKVRQVPLSAFAYPALFDWLSVRRDVPTRSDALFLSDEGAPMRPKAVYRACRWIARRTEARHPLHPHLCRRTFATHQLAATGDLRAVQEVLGHASVATTQIYTHVDHAALRRVVEAAGLAKSEHAVGPLVS